MSLRQFRWTGVLVAIGLASGSAVGQTVVVSVTSQPTGTVLSGALVSLQDQAGKRIVQTLADERGRASLTALAASRTACPADPSPMRRSRFDPISLLSGTWGPW